MGQVDASVAEPHAGVGCGEHHVPPRLHVVWILHRSRKKVVYHAKRLQGPYVTDRVGSLVGGSKNRALRVWSFREGDGGV